MDVSWFAFMTFRAKEEEKMLFTSWTKLIAATAFAISTSIAPGWADNRTHYFVAVDNRTHIIGGVYNGLPNPNAGRLTFLFAHTDEEEPSTNHFHGIGVYSYTGPADSPVIISTNTNNRLPETFTLQPPITLTPQGERFVSSLTGEEYANLKTESVQSLSGFPPDSFEGFLFNSSQGRWTTPLPGAVVTLELVAITPGLHISNEAGQEILTNVGDTYTLGDGDNFAFTPTFWTSATAAPGTYSATFKLKDTSGGNAPFGESGTFHLDFRVPSCFGVRATIVGTETGEVLHGTAGNDIIVALGGNDTIDGKGGKDFICGDGGDDIIDGGSGSDKIDGGDGNDHLRGGAGNDEIFGGAGMDDIDGGLGTDLLNGGADADVINGGPGKDIIHGGEGDDLMDGGSGPDLIDGGEGTDTANGGLGVDMCSAIETATQCENSEDPA